MEKRIFDSPADCHRHYIGFIVKLSAEIRSVIPQFTTIGLEQWLKTLESSVRSRQEEMYRKGFDCVKQEAADVDALISELRERYADIN